MKISSRIQNSKRQEFCPTNARSNKQEAVIQLLEIYSCVTFVLLKWFISTCYIQSSGYSRFNQHSPDGSSWEMRIRLIILTQVFREMECLVLWIIVGKERSWLQWELSIKAPIVGSCLKIKWKFHIYMKYHFSGM